MSKTLGDSILEQLEKDSYTPAEVVDLIMIGIAGATNSSATREEMVALAKAWKSLPIDGEDNTETV